MSDRTIQKGPSVRWRRLRELIPTMVFLIVAALLELLIVLYAVGLGVKDASVLQWSYQSLAISISPLFNLVPICVTIALVFSWLYLTRRIALRRQEIRKGKVETFSKPKTEKKRIDLGIGRAFRKVSRRLGPKLSKAPIKSALLILLSFLASIALFSVLAYPQLIYGAVTSMYRTNASLGNFVASVNNWARGAAQALGPIGWISTAINNAVLSAAPGLRNFGVGLGGLIAPLARLDGDGKYLVLQNAAVWISMLFVLVYGESIRKGYRYKK